MIDSLDSKDLEYDNQIMLSVDENDSILFELSDNNEYVDKNLKRQPEFGEVKILEDGRVKYEPKKDYDGRDSFILAVQKDGEVINKKINIRVTSNGNESTNIEDSKKTDDIEIKKQKQKKVDKKKLDEAKQQLDQKEIEQMNQMSSIDNKRIDIYKNYSQVKKAPDDVKHNLMVEDKNGNKNYILETDRTNSFIEFDEKKYVMIRDQEGNKNLFCLEKKEKLIDDKKALYVRIDRDLVDIGSDKLIPVRWNNMDFRGYVSLKNEQIDLGKDDDISYIYQGQRKEGEFKGKFFKGELYKGFMETDKGKYILINTKGNGEKKYKIVDLTNDFQVVDESDHMLYYHVNEDGKVSIVSFSIIDNIKRFIFPGNTKIGNKVN